jgi:sec-independent protein translocase protein TatA
VSFSPVRRICGAALARGRNQALSCGAVIGDILQPTHLLFILVVALLVLGPKRLPEVGRALGRGLRDFRSALNTDELRDQMVSTTSTYAPMPTVQQPVNYSQTSVATEPATAVQTTPEPFTTAEATPESATAEQASPEPATVQQPTIEPATVEQASPEASVSAPAGERTN